MSASAQGRNRGGSEIAVYGEKAYKLSFTSQKKDSAVLDGVFKDEGFAGNVVVKNIGNVPARGSVLTLEDRSPSAEPSAESEPFQRYQFALQQSPRNEAEVKKARAALGESDKKTPLSTDARCVGNASIAICDLGIIQPGKSTSVDSAYDLMWKIEATNVEEGDSGSTERPGL
ncbi:hypothetical protein ACH4TY_22920 [Streptomyces anulatus]